METATILMINLEFVNYCNLRCKWCSLDHTQKKEIMNERLLHILFQNLISDRRFREIKGLNLWNGGEILLHPNFVKMLKVIKKYKDIFLKKGLSFPCVYLLTNGILLNKELSNQLVNLDVVNVIRFSVDGGSKEKYEEIRKGAKWDIIFKNIQMSTS